MQGFLEKKKPRKGGSGRIRNSDFVQIWNFEKVSEEIAIYFFWLN